MKADSITGRIGVAYCDQLFHIERKITDLSLEERVQIRQQESTPIVEEFSAWLERSPFFGKNAIAKAAEYILSRTNKLKVFLYFKQQKEGWKKFILYCKGGVVNLINYFKEY